MTSPMEDMQDPALTSFEIEQVNNLEISPDDLPDVDAAARRGGRVPRTVKVVPYSGNVDEWIKKSISPITQKRILAAEGVSEHGNGMPRELGHEAGNLKIGAGVSVSLAVNDQGGFTDDPDQEGTEGDQVPVGVALLDDLPDRARMVEYLRNHKTYLSGFSLLAYGLHSSLGMLKEGFPRPTPAKKALWYLLFGNVGTIFVLVTMLGLALALRGSTKVRLLVNCITAAGVLMFGLNLALLYLKYQP